MTAAGGGVALAVAAAVLFGVGSVVQQEVAAGVSDGGRVPVRRLLTRPGWLLSQAVLGAATALQVGALALAPVPVVQPVLSAGLGVALGLRLARDRRAPGATEVLGAVAASAGLAVFLVAAHPRDGAAHLPSTAAVVGTAAGTVAVAVLAARQPRGRAGVLPAAAGAALALGVSTVLTAAALHVLRTSGVLTALTSAPLWCTAVVALAAEYATQQAFGRGPLARSLPLLSVAEPVVAVTGAALLLGQPLAGGHAGAWLPGALAAAGGVVLLARSPSAEGGGNPAAPDRAAPDRPASGATGRFPPATAAADHPG